jgi:hypothetical protein
MDEDMEEVRKILKMVFTGGIIFVVVAILTLGIVAYALLGVFK